MVTGLGTERSSGTWTRTVSEEQRVPVTSSERWDPHTCLPQKAPVQPAGHCGQPVKCHQQEQPGFINDLINPESAEMVGGYGWAQLILRMLKALLSPHKAAHFLLFITWTLTKGRTVTFRGRGQQNCFLPIYLFFAGGNSGKEQK